MANSTLSILTALQGKTILVSGCTGYLGKAFLEKLLRYSKDVKKIYLLVRAPDQAAANARLADEILHSSAFDLYKSLAPDHFQAAVEKLEAVAGDVTLPNLGIAKKQELQIRSDVNLVINCAASVDFQAPLSESLRSNHGSVVELVALLSTMPNTRLVHVSTCYVCGQRTGLIEEKSWAPKSGGPQLYKRILAEIAIELSALEGKNASGGNGATTTSDGGAAGKRFATRYNFADVYTLTKWLGEQHLFNHAPALKGRCLILRPSIIESSFLEPQPGWIEGCKVADPLILLAGSGQMRFFPGNPRFNLDLIPVDFVVNGIFIGMAQLEGEKPAPSEGVPVLQVASSSTFPLSLAHIVNYTLQGFHHRLKFAIIPFFLPLLFIRMFIRGVELWCDLIRRHAPVKARVMTSDIKLFTKMVDLFSPYTFLNVSFSTHNLRQAFDQLVPTEKQRFPIEFPKEHWCYYLKNSHIPGLLRWVASCEPKILKLLKMDKAA